MEIALLERCRGNLARDRPPLPPTSSIFFPGGELCIGDPTEILGTRQILERRRERLLFRHVWPLLLLCTHIK